MILFIFNRAHFNRVPCSILFAVGMIRNIHTQQCLKDRQYFMNIIGNFNVKERLIASNQILKHMINTHVLYKGDWVDYRCLFWSLYVLFGCNSFIYMARVTCKNDLYGHLNMMIWKDSFKKKWYYWYWYDYVYWKVYKLSWNKQKRLKRIYPGQTKHFFW